MSINRILLALLLLVSACGGWAQDLGLGPPPASSGGGGGDLTSGPITSSSGVSAVAAQTGTGSTFVMDTSPTLVTPNLGTPSAGVLTSCTGTAAGLTAGNVTTNHNMTGPITGTGNVTSITAQTGTGTTFVMNTSPTLVTPNLGTPTAGVLTSCTGTAAGLTAGLATDTVTKTGTGSTYATNTSPTFITPLLGTPTSGVLTNCTGTASGLTAGNVTTNANLTGPITSTGNATAIAAQTGTGTTFVMNTSPTLVTPVLGAATGTSIVLTGALTSNALTATRVVYSGTSGLLADDSGFTRTSTVLVVDASTDGTYTHGYTKQGFVSGGTATKAYWAHSTTFTTAGFALAQNSSGGTTVNAPTGQTVGIAINGTAKWSCGTQITVTIAESNTATTDSTSISTGTYTTTGGTSCAKNIICGEGMHCGVTSTATAAGTTTLTSASTGVQFFTGATTQTVQLPAANLLGAGVGVHYVLVNRSSGSVSWQRAGSDTINGATSTVAVTTNTTGDIYSDGVSAWVTR